MPRKKREEEIVKAVREYLTHAEKGLQQITDDRLIKASNCARATFYKYVTEGSMIEREIETARRRQEAYAKALESSGAEVREETTRKRLVEAEEGNRKLLALVATMTANLIRQGIPARVIQAAQSDAITHPTRSYSHAGKGRRKRRRW